MDPKPPISAPLASSGKGCVEEEKGPARGGSPPSINLGLGIGAGSGLDSGRPNRVKTELTPAQSHELQQQRLVLNNLVAGLPVPFHLIPPFCNGVVGSFAPVNGGIYNPHPNLVGFSPPGFDYRSMTDPEPGRCRRTDGKKWRCSRDVVPEQKYCERHMHRGCKRSRKHVEASEIASESGPTPHPNNTTATKNSNDRIDTKSNNISKSVPVNLQLATPAATAPTPSTTTTGIAGISGSADNVPNSGNTKSNSSVYGEKDTTNTTTTAVTTKTANVTASNSHFLNWVNDKGGINNVNNCKVGSFVAPGFGFSTETFLGGCSSSCDDCSDIPETELQRCRRTDGRKWRCGKDVIPNQRYCGRHFRRGVKKVVAASQLVTVAAAPPPLLNSVFLSPPLAIPKKAVGDINSDTNLSISIVASPRQITMDEASPTSSGSSSDATTITDENGSVSHLSN